MTRRAERGGAQVLLIALVALCGAGAWNYHRNLVAEQVDHTARPLSGYSTADLESLADAYRSEIARYEAKYRGQRAQRNEARDRAHFGDQVGELEKVQRAARRTREAGAEVAEREAALRDVEAELAARGPERPAWQVHLERLTRL